MQVKKYQLWLLSLLSGLLMGLAWPVNGFTPLIFIAWIPLLFVRDFVRNNDSQFSRGAMVLYSYLSFIVFNLFTTWWVSYSTIEGAIMAFVLNTLFMSLVFGLAHNADKYLFKSRSGFFVLIFFWISYEYLHMNWDLTWSWLNMGNVFSENPQWVQWYRYTGALGGTAWLIAINLLLFAIINSLIKTKGNFKAALLNIATFVFVIIAPLLLSYSILNEDSEADLPSVNVLLVQPNIDPYTEAYSLSSDQLINNMLNVVRDNINENTELIFTPESTIERSMWEDKILLYSAIDSIERYISEHPHLQFIIGASTRRKLLPNEEVKTAARKMMNLDNAYYYNYNAALFIRYNRKIEFYHKAKLVPGVERLPFTFILKNFESLAIDLGGTIGSLGVSDKQSVFDFGDNRKVAPVICYESIYGEHVGGYSNYGSGFIAVITNDAWWSNSPGYKQHFSYARLRAIENNQYVVRAANTGVSGVIDNKGNVLSTTEFNTKTAVNATIPLNNTPTYYAKNGDYLAKFSLFILTLLFVISVSKKLRK